MRKWIEEKVLQRYFVENANRYNLVIEGAQKSIDQAKFNSSFDRFPDLRCYIDGEEYPAEVEWTSGDFDHYDHDDYDSYLDQGLFVIVLKKDRTLRNDLQQVEVDTTHFKQWFDNQASAIIIETLEQIEERAVADRKFSKIWAIYLPVRGRAVQNYEIGVDQGVWGFTDSRFDSSADRIRDIQRRDLILFYGPFSGDTRKHSTRMEFDDYYDVVTDHHSIECMYIRAHQVMEGYWEEREKPEYNPIWPDENKMNEKYPHRFSFSGRPIVDESNVPLHTLPKSTLEPLHHGADHGIQDLAHHHFPDIIGSVTRGAE